MKKIISRQRKWQTLNPEKAKVIADRFRKSENGKKYFREYQQKHYYDKYNYCHLIRVAKGTTIHIGGTPFELLADTWIGNNTKRKAELDFSQPELVIKEVFNPHLKNLLKPKELTN